MTEYLEPADVEDFTKSAGFHLKKGGRDLLLSALASPLPVFGEDVYLGLYNKAAILLISINQNHPLADGNKRAVVGGNESVPGTQWASPCRR